MKFWNQHTDRSGERQIFIDWKNKQSNTVVAADFYSIADTDQAESIPLKTEILDYNTAKREAYIPNLEVADALETLHSSVSSVLQYNNEAS